MQHMLMTISVIATPVLATLRLAHPALLQNLDILPKINCASATPGVCIGSRGQQHSHPAWQTLSVQYKAPATVHFQHGFADFDAMVESVRFR